MTHAELRAARERLGLTPEELADMLYLERQAVYRMEMEPGRKSRRKVAGPVARLVELYLAGVRPADWPGGAGTVIDEGEKSIPGR